ncbi:MAG: signal peptide peptidase SppA [Planctomycetes bacterium]|nr:signal peptide peptidase SppA [Planctomycetota bacterium]
MPRCFWALICLAVTVAVFPVPGAYAQEKDAPAGTVTFGEIDIKGSYAEGATAPGLFGELSENLDTALGRIEKAASDDKVDGLILKIHSPTIGWAKMNAFRKSIARVQAKGKKVYAWMADGSNIDYALASACDDVSMPQPGTLMLVGVRAEVTFYKKLFDMIGVKADMLRVGEFKSAAETYTRSEMSPEFRQEMEEIVDDRYEQLVETLAKARKLTPEKVKSIIDEAPLTAQQAQKLGLLDRLAYEDDLEAAISKAHAGKTLKVVKKYGKKKTDTDFSGLAGMMKMMEMLMGVEQPKRKSKEPKIAVIYASGMITTGKSSADFLSGESSMGSDTMVKAIRDANKDATVKAIVLRVDSPGGSALASDLIWHELELVQKPFVVSMGDVAGSGGYYIAMGAKRIFADPGTITGSIGVVGGKLALNGMFGKVGITTDVISRGKNSGILSMTHSFSDTERDSMQRLLNDIYEQFTTKAAKGRKMEHEKLEKLARGRVYTGRAALKIGLVDELGTLDDALAYTKQQIGLAADAKIELLNLPKATSPLESLLGPIDPNADARAAQAAVRSLLREISPELEQNVQALQVLQILSRERSLTVMPFRLVVK